MSQSPPPSLTSKRWTALERLVEEFEGAWQRGQRPDVAALLPADSALRPAALVELIHAELELRLKAGEPARVEEYLIRFPELAGNLQAVGELIAAEFALRQRGDAELSRGEYRQRFPQFADDFQPEAANEHSATVRLGNGRGGLTRELPGQQRYRPIKFHASGGLGEVHVAEDLELRRAVALKRIQGRHRNDPESRRRFLREAEITARLEHPGVVPIHGLTLDDDGQPCYAMRFIEGESLQFALRRFHLEHPRGDAPERRLGLRQLLSRFVAVCNTIAYAHSQGVIHRDIKPQNVMLGTYGETMVIDWGLAKAGDVGQAFLPAKSDGRQECLPHNQGDSETVLGQVMGTPAYMSPEQAAGRWDQVGPASDIYSLGATLYELLVGKPPADPLVPPRRVKSDVPRPLDAICQKALATDPQQRYATADALGQDVERWLADEPVTAYPEPVGVRARRWVQGHRTLVTALSLATIVALVTLSIATVLLEIARDGEALAKEEAWERQREMKIARDDEHEARVKEQAATRRAEVNFQREQKSYWLARAALERAMQLQKDPRFQQGPLESVRRTLQEAEADFYQKFLELRGDDPAFQAERAKSLEHLGYLTAQLRSKKDALPYFEQSIAVYRSILEADPAARPARAELAAAYSNYATALNDLGDAKGARQAFDQALAELAVLKRAGVGEPRREAIVWNNRGILLEHGGAPAEALVSYEQARKLLEGLLAHEPDDRPSRRLLATACYNLGNTFGRFGKFADARTVLERARELQEELVVQADAGLEEHHELARTCYNLATQHYDQGRLTESEKLFTRALALQEELVKKHPEVRHTALQLAQVEYRFAPILALRGRFDESSRLLERAYERLSRLDCEHAGQADIQRDLAVAAGRTAEVLTDQGKLDVAGERLEKARVLLETLVARQPGHLDNRRHLAETYQLLARHALRSGQFADVPKHCERADALWEALAQEQPGDVGLRDQRAHSDAIRGQAQRGSGRLDEAIRWLKQARARREHLAHESPQALYLHLNLGRTCFQLAAVQRESGKAEEALASFDQARTALKRLQGTPADNTELRNLLAEVVLEKGTTLMALGRLQDGFQSYEEARGLLEELARAQPAVTGFRSNLAAVTYNIAHHQGRAGQRIAAVQGYQKAIELFEQLRKERPGDARFGFNLLRARVNLGSLQLDREPEDARATYERAVALGEELLQANPPAPGVAPMVGLSHLALGMLAAGKERYEEARERFGKAIARLEPVVKEQPGNAEARQFLCQALSQRARTLNEQNLPTDALADWDRVIALRPGRLDQTTGRATALALKGDLAPALTVADRALQERTLPLLVRYDLAVIFAQASTAALKDETLTKDERAKKSEQFATQAVAQLRLMREAGYRDAEALRRSVALAPLRGRADFEEALKQFTTR